MSVMICMKWRGPPVWQVRSLCGVWILSRVCWVNCVLLEWVSCLAWTGVWTEENCMNWLCELNRTCCGRFMHRVCMKGGLYMHWVCMKGGLYMHQVCMKGGLYMHRVCMKGGLYMHRACMKGGLYMHWVCMKGGLYMHRVCMKGGLYMHRVCMKGGHYIHRVCMKGGLLLRLCACVAHEIWKWSQ